MIFESFDHLISAHDGSCEESACETDEEDEDGFTVDSPSVPQIHVGDIGELGLKKIRVPRS